LKEAKMKRIVRNCFTLLNIVISLAVVTGLLLSSFKVNAIDLDTSNLTCSKGMKLYIYDQPQEGTIPLNDKHVRCELIQVECPWGLKPAYFETKVYGSTPAHGKYVRCDNEFLPSAGKPEEPSDKAGNGRQLY
jgi:hypothetical protein